MIVFDQNISLKTYFFRNTLCFTSSLMNSSWNTFSIFKMQLRTNCTTCVMQLIVFFSWFQIWSNCSLILLRKCFRSVSLNAALSVVIVNKSVSIKYFVKKFSTIANISYFAWLFINDLKSSKASLYTQSNVM